MDSTREISPFCIGLDIGFGNLKAAGGFAGGGTVKEVVLPVGAAPAYTLNRDDRDRPIVGDGALVMIEGEEWGVGLRPLDADKFERKVNENYPLSTEYYGLFLGALAKFGESKVKVIVTGLPVSQYYANAQVNLAPKIVAKLQGDHYVNTRLKTVSVERVVVVPQPIGGFNHQSGIEPKIGRDKDKLCLVIDVGYFSVDWVLMRGVNVLRSGSGSSTNATSRILEEASSRIAEAAGGAKISSMRVESAFREGRQEIEIGQNVIQVMNYINGAASQLGRAVMTEISNSLRSINDTVDQVLLLGGGGRLYAAAAQSEFPKAVILEGGDAVMSNALGFQKLARQVATPRR